MGKAFVAYSRNNILPDDVSEEYQLKAKILLDCINRELCEIKDNPIERFNVTLEQVLTNNSWVLENIYLMVINDTLVWQFRINDFLDKEPRFIANKLIDKVKENQ